jgi:hypothetical protein
MRTYLFEFLLSSVWLIMLVVVIFCVTRAGAQELPADVKYFPNGGLGKYDVKATVPDPSNDPVQICVERVDVTPPEQVGCAPYAGDGQVTIIPVLVSVTPHDDAELRAYSNDDSGNVSEPSPNAGLIDFTPPGKARFESTP